MPKLEFYDGTAWNTVGTGNGTVTSVTAGTGLTGTGTATDPIISMPATGTAGTYAFPASVITDAQGRVVTITAGTAPVTSITGTASQITVTGTTTPVLSLPAAIITPGTLTVNSTSFFQTAVGTTLQRPPTPVAGMFRLNTSL